MDELEINTEMVRKLLSTYACKWAELPIEEINSTGTDNALFMLGNDCVLRMPKRESAAILLEKELTWLPVLQGLPLAVPELLLHGKSKQDFGFEFGIFNWIPGQVASRDQITDLKQATLNLAGFLTALQDVNTDHAPRAGQQNNNRGIDLVELTRKVYSSINVLADEIDVTKACELWERACSVPIAERSVWIHGDLKADNMIAVDGALAGVIDWGLSAVGDAAVDFAVVWTWVAPNNRELFRRKCQIDENDWQRAKGWALYCAVIALSYYRGRSHDALCNHSRITLRRLGLLCS